MSLINAQNAGAARASQVTDLLFDLALYLLVVMGFVTLVSSGGLDLPTALMVGAAVAFRGFLIVQRKAVVISERWTTPLTLAYFAFFAVDYFVVSRSFLAATVHLALFAVVVRMFSLRRERDCVMLAVLAFLMVLASAVLTVDGVFLLCFAGFMLMAVGTFALMEMRRSARSATFVARPSIDPLERRRFAIWLARLAPALMFAILAGSVAIFFLLPRMSAGYMGAYSFGTDFSTGFSDQVRLGRIGEIQQSNAVAMHIRIDGDTDGRHDLYWRGVALSVFDGRTWSNPRETFLLEKRPGNDFEVPPFGTPFSTDPLQATASGANAPRANMIHYRVLMEPIGTNVFFLAPWARRVIGDYRLLSVDSGAAVHNLDSARPIRSYEGESDIAVPSAQDLRTSVDSYPQQVIPAYLQLPRLDPRIPALAVQIAGSASNNYDRATAVEHYLTTHYGYTLQLPGSIDGDPLANFLFQRREGHCEYFASAMAVMLRTLKIPARVVNGFRSDEFNDLSGNYVVRAKDAHAWVEAYFPGYGWQTFDPTPAGGSGAPRGWARAALYVDAAASFWREWVVSYDSAHQYVLGQTALDETHGLWERLRVSAQHRYDAMLGWARRRQSLLRPSSHSLIGIGIAAGLFFLGLLFLGLRYAGRIAWWIQGKSLPRHKGRAPEHAAAMWYTRMLSFLTRRGIPKGPTRTAREFAQTIGDDNLRKRVSEFTEAYESARFGNSAEEAERLPQLFEEVESAMKK